MLALKMLRFLAALWNQGFRLRAPRRDRDNTDWIDRPRPLGTVLIYAGARGSQCAGWSVGATGTMRASPGLLDVLEQLATVRPAWMKDALCREYPGVDFFANTGPGIDAAKAVCGRCACEDACQVYGITHEQPAGNGVWGGLSANDRRAMRRGAA